MVEKQSGGGKTDEHETEVRLPFKNLPPYAVPPPAATYWHVSPYRAESDMGYGDLLVVSVIHSFKRSQYYWELITQGNNKQNGKRRQGRERERKIGKS